MEELDENEEQLVIDLAAQYSDAMVSGEEVNMQEIMEKLPNERTKDKFRTICNMSRFISTIENIRKDESEEGEK